MRAAAARRGAAARAAGAAAGLRASPDFQPGGSAAWDPELGALLVAGRTRAMYRAEHWPAAAEPRAASRHEEEARHSREAADAYLQRLGRRAVGFSLCLVA